MNKSLFFVSCALLFVVSLKAQDLVSTAGTSGQTTNGYHTFSVGEIITETILDNNTPVTQGYNQPISICADMGLTAQMSDISCFGDSIGAIYFTGGTGTLSYAWSTGNVTSILDNLLAGAYAVTVTDDQGCQVNYAFILNEPDSLSIIYETIQLDETTNQVTVSVMGGVDPYALLWADGDTSAVKEFQSNGAFELSITDSLGCTRLFTISLFDENNACLGKNIPSAFTPNGDGVNDAWILNGISSNPNLEVHVMNRWGVEIFTSDSYVEPWDGTFNGNDLPGTTYYYIVKVAEGIECIGTVNIVR